MKRATGYPHGSYTDVLRPAAPQSAGGKPRNVVTGQCAPGGGLGRRVRLIELHYPEPQSGIIIVTNNLTGDWRTILTMSGSLGGPTETRDFTGLTRRVALSWAGEHVILEVEELTALAGRRFCAVAGLDGASADATGSLDIGTADGPVVRVQDGNGSSDLLYVNEENAVPVGVPAGALVNGMVRTAVPAALLSAARPAHPTLDDNRSLLTTYALRQLRTRGTINQNAFGAGGTATLIAAPGAGLANVLYSVQIGVLTVASVVTLESPSGTVLWAASLNVGGQQPIVFPVPLVGAANGAWVVRSSAASTFSANAQGATERVA